MLMRYASISKAGRRRSGMSGQTAMEYLATYGWALIIIAVVTGGIYYFFLLPKSTVSMQCTVASGFYCDDVTVGGYGQSGGSVVLLMTNRQQYPVMNPIVNLSVGGSNTSATCMTTYATAGGSVLCAVSTPVQLSPGQLVSGQFFVKARYCGLLPDPSNLSSCGSVPRQIYTGAFMVQASGPVNPSVSIALSASPNPGYTGTGSQLRATVTAMGYPMGGATVNFTSNSTSAPISPSLVTTDSLGNATTRIVPTSGGVVLITASYSGTSAAISMQFIQRTTTTGSSTTSVSTTSTSVTSTSTTSTSTTSTSTTSTSITTTSTTTTISVLLTGAVSPSFASVDQGNTVMLTAVWSCSTCTMPYTAKFYWSTLPGSCSSFTQFGSAAPVNSPNAIVSPALTATGTSYFCARLNDSSGQSNYTSVASVRVNQSPISSLSVTPTTFPFGSSTTLTTSWAYGTPPYDVTLAAGTGQSCNSLLSNSIWSYSTGYGATSPYHSTVTSGSGSDITTAGNYMVCAKVTDNMSESSTTGAIAISVT